MPFIRARVLFFLPFFGNCHYSRLQTVQEYPFFFFSPIAVFTMRLIRPLVLNLRRYSWRAYLLSITAEWLFYVLCPSLQPKTLKPAPLVFSFLLIRSILVSLLPLPLAVSSISSLPFTPGSSAHFFFIVMLVLDSLAPAFCYARTFSGTILYVFLRMTLLPCIHAIGSILNNHTLFL